MKRSAVSSVFLRISTSLLFASSLSACQDTSIKAGGTSETPCPIYPNFDPQNPPEGVSYCDPSACKIKLIWDDGKKPFNYCCEKNTAEECCEVPLKPQGDDYVCKPSNPQDPGVLTTTFTPTTTDTDSNSDTTTSTTGDDTTTSTTGDDTSTTSGEENLCGNDVIDRGEQCDDGNANTFDACTNICKKAICGDSITQTGVEQCDEGAANSNQGSCTNACKVAYCGDGFIQKDVEQCDNTPPPQGALCDNQRSCLLKCEPGYEECKPGDALTTGCKLKGTCPNP